MKEKKSDLIKNIHNLTPPKLKDTSVQIANLTLLSDSNGITLLQSVVTGVCYVVGKSSSPIGERIFLQELRLK